VALTMGESAPRASTAVRELEAGGTSMRGTPLRRPLWLCFTSPLLLVVAGGCAASSQSAKTSSAPEQQQFAVTARGNTVAPPPGDQLICEYEETVGSHIPKRICRSKSELEKVRDETQQNMRTLRDVPPPKGN